MAEEKESTSIPLSQADNVSCEDPEDPAKTPPTSPNSSTRRVGSPNPFYFFTLQIRAKFSILFIALYFLILLCYL